MAYVCSTDLPQLAIGLGLFFATIIVVSGITATVFQFHDDSDVQREVFGNIPSEWRLLFYTVFPVLVIYGSVLFSQRVRNWQRGGPDKRSTTKKNVGRRMKDFRSAESRVGTECEGRCRYRGWTSQ